MSTTVYGNAKTGKYHAKKRGDQCRQREILKANLVKFDDPKTAEKAGLKACKACYPAEARRT